MTRTCAVGLLALLASGSIGCRFFEANRAEKASTPPPDSGAYLDRSTEAQERRGRARYALTEDDFRIGPRTYADRPDPVAGGSSGGVAGPR
jgi:hypothetical protein